jgi:Domain of unknown function (DUF932)
MLTAPVTARARFDTCSPLTEDELRKTAPSIFAVEPHHSRSQRFAPIATTQVLGALAKEGFHAVGVKQVRTRDTDRRDFTKHMVRLRRRDDADSFTVGGTTFEILLKNANDGSSSYQLLAGLFRILCLNGLIVGTASENIRVRHTGDVIGEVIEGSYRILATARQALTAPAEWSKQILSDAEREMFAEVALKLRFSDAEGNVATPIQPRQLLEPRRAADKSRDLWTTFNVVQENVIRGGLHAVGRDANNRRRRITTRPVNGIDQDVKLNKALWVLAEGMAQVEIAA